MVAQGLVALFADEDGVEVVGASRTSAEAVRAAAHSQPDVVLMDYGLPDGDGVEATRQVLAVSPDSKVVIFTGSVGDDVLVDALDAGAIGLVHKSAPIADLVSAVRAAAVGDAYVPAELLLRLVRRRSDAALVEAPSNDVTARELEVLQDAADGLSLAEIAGRLDLSVHTVRNHVRRAMAKLGVHTKLDAVVAAARLGLIRIGPPRSPTITSSDHTT